VPVIGPIAEQVEAKNVIYTAPSVGTPKARLIPLPEIPGASAIWGGTGRDHRGNVTVGVSCEPLPKGSSSHLFSLNPVNDSVTDLGGVVEKLNGDGPNSQNKIHTKILQAADGKIYFASMDEYGENDDGSRLSQKGSYLWRLTPGQSEWEKLRHVEEGIIAAAVGGRFVYYLGYYGHVLYQFDTTLNRITNTTRVGSIGGHTTRNFFADSQGHAYVPRVSAMAAELVEFDDDGREVKAHPLADYSLTPDASSHGIVGVAPLKDGAWLFTTDRGRLYRLDPRATGSSLTDLGRIAEGESYPSCLFSLDGETQVCTIIEREQCLWWLRFDLKLRESTRVKLDLPLPPGARNLLVYGSFTRSDTGRCYVGGRYLKNVGEATVSVPALWTIEP